MPRNEDLPGVEGEGVSAQKTIKAVDEAFEELIAQRTKRMNAGEKEGEASAKLVALFHKHNLKVYTFDDKKYTLSTIETIKRKPKDEENGE